MKFRLFPLETRCVMFERKLHAANMHMFKTLASSWRKKAINFDPYEVIIQYKRTFPLDLSYEADVQGKLKGLVSEQTRLNLASFIDDAEYEQELMKQEETDISSYYTTQASDEVNGDELGEIPANTRTEE